MSRAAQSKSRNDKKGGPSAPTPAVTHEIVPGKFTDVDWNRMLELDDGEDFAGELIDEVVANSLTIIYEKYIERQLLPYTISQAKEALLTIIDWRFLACDPGESNPCTDPTWQEDEEPTAAVPDCWAQGSVPKTFISNRPVSAASIRDDPTSLMNEPIAEEPGTGEVILDEQSQPWIVSDEQILAEETVQGSCEPAQQDTQEKMSPTPPAVTKTKKRKFRPKKGRLPSAGVSNVCVSLDDMERRISTEERMREVATVQNTEEKTGFNPMPKSVGSILKNSSKTDNVTPSDIHKTASAHSSSVSNATPQFQSGRPPGSRDVYYDDHGNVIAMSKIDPNKLPTHRIKTKFYVVDPAVEAAQARLDAMRTGRYQASTSKQPKKPALTVSDKTKLDKSSILDYRSVNSNTTSPRKGRGGAIGHYTSKSDTSMTPLPPPMIESMELAPGVVVREGDRVKKGPRQMTRTADKLPRKEKLRPVGAEPDMTISVKELLGHTSPLVRIEPTPVPPIMNRHNITNVQKIST